MVQADSVPPVDPLLFCPLVDRFPVAIVAPPAPAPLPVPFSPASPIPPPFPPLLLLPAPPPPPNATRTLAFL